MYPSSMVSREEYSYVLQATLVIVKKVGTSSACQLCSTALLLWGDSTIRSSSQRRVAAALVVLVSSLIKLWLVLLWLSWWSSFPPQQLPKLQLSHFLLPPALCNWCHRLFTLAILDINQHVVQEFLKINTSHWIFKMRIPTAGVVK